VPRDGRGDRDDVGRGRIEGERLSRFETARVAIIELQRLRRPFDRDGVGTRVEIRAAQLSGYRHVVRNRQRKGTRRVWWNALRDELQRLTRRVLVLFQTPALERARLRGKDRPHFGGFHDDLLFGNV